MQEDSQKKKFVQWLGFALGPIMALFCLLALPKNYSVVSSADPVSSAGSRSSDNSQSSEESGDPSAQISRDSEATVQNVLADSPSKSAPQATVHESEFSWAGRATLAVMVWMGVWWLCEAIHISLTALLPIVLFPLLGAASIGDATAPYANHLIYLYFGGFVLALSMERWGLGKRLALVTMRWVGTSAPQMLAGFMLVTAVLSAFVSNTATTAMMLPIALSVIALLRGQHRSEKGVDDPRVEQFGTCLLLGIAYSASVGGIMTIIGTPTNAFLVGFLRDNIANEHQTDFSFAGWLPIGVSLAVVFLPILYFVLTRVLFPIQGIQLSGGKQMLASEIASLGKIHRGEWNTFFVFLATITLWLIRPLISNMEVTWAGTVIQPFSKLSDTGIAMTAAMALFLLPVDAGKRVFTMDWETTAKLPWEILILFGGGLSLAAAVKANGVAEFIGSFAGAFGSLPTVVVIILVTAAIVFLTELTSNVATTTSLVPVLAALAPGLDIHPYLLIFPATIASSCAFMLPVATPPNAIVFGSGAITLPQMIRAGFLFNLVTIVLVTLLTFVVVRPFLGV